MMDRAAGERASVAYRRSSATVSFVPTHVDVDVEGDRLRVIDNLLETVRFEQNAQEQQQQSVKHGEAALTTINSFASSSAAAATPPPNVILSKYVLDYGPVIKGTSKTKRFRLQNIGFHHVSFSVDASLLASCGFSLDPETTIRLPGAPEFETTELALTLQTSRLDSSVENVELCVPLELKNGPSIALNLRAAITVPEITVSTDVLDFGRVVAGNVSVISLQLHNPVEVPCEWSIRRPIGNYRYWSLFECSVSTGVIAPGGRVDMHVMFRPQQELAGVHVQKLQFRVNHSSRPITITVQGEGLARDVCFDRTEVELGALLPGDEKSTTVTMTNESDVSVELYSVDFDDEYIVQERVLRACDSYDSTNEMLMPVRDIGAGLWEELLVNCAFVSDVLANEDTTENNGGVQKKAAVVADAAEQEEASLATDESTTTTTTEGQAAAASRGSDNSAAAATEAKAAGAVVDEGDNTATSPTVVDETPKIEMTQSWPEVDDTTNIILVGDTDAGTPLAVYAERLSARFGIGILAIDKIIASLQSGAKDEEMQAQVDVLKDESLTLTEKDAGAPPPSTAATGAPLSPDHESAGEVADSGGVEQADGDAKNVSAERLTGALTEALHAGFSGGVILSIGLLPESLPCSDAVGSVLQSLGIVQEDMVSEIPVSDDASEELAPENTDAAAATGEIRKGLWRGPKKIHVIILQNTTKSAAGDGKTDDIPPSPSSTFAESAALLRTFLAQGTHEESNTAAVACVSVYSLDDAHDAEDIDAVNAVYRNMCQALPETATADPFYIKEQYTKEIIRRPSLRPDRRPIQYFSLYSKMEDLPETPSASPSPVKDGIAGEGSDLRPEKPVVHVKKTRWIIPPHSSVELTVKFTSDVVGKFEEELCFEMVGVQGVQRKLRVRGTCAYPQISTDYRNVFYRKLKTRPPTPQISKQYIITKQTFEFGAVLCGKDDTKVLAGEYAENQERFRITNNGLFDLKASFALRAVPKPLPSMSGALSSATTVADSDGDEAAVQDDGTNVTSEGTEEEPDSSLEPSGIFHISPTEMSLAVEETAELVVSAMPRKDGHVNEVIVCSIEGNPIPIEFPISCLGAVPRVTLSTNELRFERLLVNHSSEMSFTFSNTAYLPCRWRLTGVDVLTSEFSVSEREGVLAARSSATVTIGFKAEKKAQYSTELTLEIVDADELLGVQQQEMLLVSAEAYEIEVEPRYPDDQTGISFGTVKVQESVCKSFELWNNGKYEVGFSMSVTKSSAIKEIFTILPENGTIEPGTSTTIEVHFNKNNKLRKEMQLVKNRDFQMSIIETLTGRREGRFPIMIDAEAVFSKYAVIPKEIDFGPNTFNTQPDAQVLEITNSGSFEFKFRLFNYTAYDLAASASPVKAGTGGADEATKAESSSKDTSKDADELTLGNFSIRPAVGSIAPGGKQVIEVRFKPEKSRTYAELLGIDISDRSDADHPGGIPFKLSGESCVPSIDTENVSSIFEEYRVVSSFDHAAMQGNRNTYSIKEKSFSFGPVIVGTGADDGVKANFRFSNTNRVGCTVRFSITPRPGQDGDIPIEVHPQSTEIPPHEHRYVTCYFRPKAIMTYSAVFNAVVEDGEDPKRQRFRCGIQGEGTLPHLSIEHAPHTGETAGQSSLSFPRMRLGKQYVLPLTLKNTGIVPATARIEMEAHDAFSLRQSGTFTVEPKRSFITEVQFAPTEAKSYTHSLRLLVKSNPFETQTLALAGECYCEDVSFEGLPGDMDDELHFKDGPVGLARTISFRVRNESRGHPIRFEWPKDASDAGKFLSFSPSAGHLAPLAEKTVTVVFAPEEAVSLAPLKLALATVKIAYNDSVSATAGLAQDWDNTQIVKKAVSKESLSLSRTPPSDVVAAPEPECTPLPDSEKSHVLKVHAVADNARYECDTGPIVFRTTMMFQSRTFSFPLRNTSTAMLEFEWQVCSTDGEPDMSSLYSVSPVSGSVPAGGEVSVTVRFSPSEVDDCERELVCMIDNLDLEFTPLRRRLSGSVSRPWCHFDLPESDYIRSGRRSSTRPAQGADDASAQVDANTKVLEFESLGVRVKNTKRFFVLNPTSVSYEFVWERVTVPAAAAAAAASGTATAGGASSNSRSIGSGGSDLDLRASSGDAKIQMPFTSLTKKGVIMPGRRYEMSFEFLPEKMDPCESLWRFRIPAQRLAVTFLLVGTVIEPAVLLSHPSLNFGKVLVGTTAKQVVEVVNEEEVPFRFSFDKASFKGLTETAQVPITEGGTSAASKQLVNITPSSGVVPPKSRVTASVEFSPTTERTMNVNVQCTIAKKPTKLMLNIKGDSYAIHEFLQISDEARSGVRVSPAAPNFVDFGQVLLYDDAIKQVVLSNGGLVPFNFSWSTGSKTKIGASPEVGTVREGERVVCKLKYRPTREEEMNGYKVTCSIQNGNSYVFFLSGKGHRPKLDFSMDKHDFGACFIHQQGMEPSRVSLCVKNEDSMEVDLDCAFASKPHLQIDFKPTTLGPGESKTISLAFLPREAIAYKETLVFTANGLRTAAIAISGEGSPLKIELANASQKVISFGSVGIGQEVTRNVKIINRSKAVASVSLEPCKLQLTENCVSYSFMEKGNTGSIRLFPRQSENLRLTFKPTRRMCAFTEELVIEAGSAVTKTLSVLTGSGLGIDVQLETESLPFGTVVLGSRLVKHVQLRSHGELGARFAWDTASLAPNFAITPSEGFIGPGQDVTLDISFTPTELSQDIRVENLTCKVAGAEPLSISLFGSCIENAAEERVLHFESKVREEDTQSIIIANPTNHAWHLKPVIENESWSGSDWLTVPANAEASYELSFRPTSMSKAGDDGSANPHLGSVFFALPNGGGVLHRMEGVATPPRASGDVAVEVRAKSVHHEVLKVHNWLHRAQRFRCILDIGSDASSKAAARDLGPKVSGPEFIDVPAHTERTYRMSFFTYVEGTYSGQVKFLNESTDEYVFYNVTFTSLPPEDISEITLETPVRQLVSETVTIENPLESSVTLSGSCAHDQVTLPASTTIEPGRRAFIEMTYRPLLVGEETCPASFSCAELGDYKYTLRLRGTPPPLDNSISFSVSLGAKQVLPFRFIHYLNAKAEYTCKFEGGTESPFEVETSRVVAFAAGAEGIEQEVEVSFEPSRLGENFRDTLVVSSPSGGEYRCVVIGRCTQPQPQGPLEIKGGSGTVAFKNIFAKEVVFKLRVDNPCFQVSETEKIASKHSKSIAISYKPGNAAGSKHCRLAISCSDSPFPWIYYITAV